MGQDRDGRRRRAASRRSPQGTAVAAEASRCRQLPGFALAPGANRIAAPVDWVDPPARLDNFYGTRVCAVDADGNEVAGIRLPPIAVPLGTYTGWNVYRAQPCELCDRDGSLIPFARTRSEREAAGDPRPSLEERYGSRDAYVAESQSRSRGAGRRPPAVAGRCRRLCQSRNRNAIGSERSEPTPRSSTRQRDRLLPTPDRRSIENPRDAPRPKYREGRMRSSMFAAAMLAAAGLIGCGWLPVFGQTLIVGNDDKNGVDQNFKPIIGEPGHDSLSVIDISNPAAPRIAATIPLINSVVGPPANLAIVPSGDIALVANSLTPVIQGWGHRLEPDDKVFVVDLKASPPKVIGTVLVGKQPSGVAISPKGDLALVANRADGTISVLSIQGKDVTVSDTVPIGAAADQVSAVAITPDGKHALAAKPAANKVALLTIDGGKVTYDKRDLPTGIFPYNVAVTPDGKLALTADNGGGGSSDGNVDTVGVIDLAANPPRVIDHVTVGDSPEGLAISPKGNLAVSIQARGLEHAEDGILSPCGRHRRHPGDRRRQGHQGRLGHGRRVARRRVAFSADGSYLYVGNFIDGDLSILKVDGANVTDTGQRFKLPGHPASMRSRPAMRRS